MRPVPMRFMGYTWHHNPKKLEIVCGKDVVKFSVPYFRQMVQSFSHKLITVRGIGELYGEDCMEQYKKLNDIFDKGEPGILCLPSIAPMYACFDKLSVVADDKPSVLTYEFSFTQTKGRDPLLPMKKTITVTEDTTLWDIAYENNVEVESLVELNPHIMFINSIQEGEVVRIC